MVKRILRSFLYSSLVDHDQDVPHVNLIGSTPSMLVVHSSSGIEFVEPGINPLNRLRGGLPLHFLLLKFGIEVAS